MEKKRDLNRFDSPDLPNSYLFMNDGIVEFYFEMEEKLETTFIINSAYRTLRHNLEVGGSPTSSHLSGEAIDVHVDDYFQRYILIKYLIDNGINRIGIYDTFIHFDIDSRKKQNVIWHF